MLRDSVCSCTSAGIGPPTATLNPSSVAVSVIREPDSRKDDDGESSAGLLMMMMVVVVEEERGWTEGEWRRRRMEIDI